MSRKSSGSASSSSAPKEKEPYEPEQAFILRVPDDIAAQLRNQMRAKSLKECELEVLDDGPRNVKFRLDKTVLNGYFAELPCIVEAYKTLDNAAYYKTADISRMIVVDRAPVPDVEGPIQLDSGLTPPAENIRKYWKKRSPPVDKAKIKALEDEWLEMIKEENSNDIQIEILEEDGSVGQSSAQVAQPKPMAPPQ